MAYIPGYFYDAVNSIIERFEAGPPSFSSFQGDPIVHDFKQTTANNTILGTFRGNELVRPGIGVQVFQRGGGIQTITVPFWATRGRRGDAEWGAYQMLVRLGGTDLGELTVHDRTYNDCWFIGGEAQVEPAWSTTPDGATLANMRLVESFRIRGELRFVRSIPSGTGLSAPSVAAPTVLPALPTAADRGDYWAVSGAGGNVKLGRYSDLVRISVDRPFTFTTIGRCYGVRIKGRGHTQTSIRTGLDYRRGRTIRLGFHGFVRTLETNNGVPDPVSVLNKGHFNEQRRVLEWRLHDLQQQLRDYVWTLAGNGNIFYDCHLISFNGEPDEPFFTSSFDCEFLQEYNEIVV